MKSAHFMMEEILDKYNWHSVTITAQRGTDSISLGEIQKYVASAKPHVHDTHLHHSEGKNPYEALRKLWGKLRKLG